MFVIMTASYIIWHEKIWVKYIVRAFWQIGLSYVERILKIKIHSCNDLSQNLIGSIIIYKILLVKNQIEYCRNVFVGLVDISLDWRNRGDPDKVNEQDKRLSTQVVFTAAISKISFMSLSYLSLSSCAFFSVLLDGMYSAKETL